MHIAWIVVLALVGVVLLVSAVFFGLKWWRAHCWNQWGQHIKSTISKIEDIINQLLTETYVHAKAYLAWGKTLSQLEIDNTPGEFKKKLDNFLLTLKQDEKTLLIECQLLSIVKTGQPLNEEVATAIRGLKFVPSPLSSDYALPYWLDEDVSLDEAICFQTLFSVGSVLSLHWGDDYKMALDSHWLVMAAIDNAIKNRDVSEKGAVLMPLSKKMLTWIKTPRTEVEKKQALIHMFDVLEHPGHLKKNHTDYACDKTLKHFFDLKAEQFCLTQLNHFYFFDISRKHHFLMKRKHSFSESTETEIKVLFDLLWKMTQFGLVKNRVPPPGLENQMEQTLSNIQSKLDLCQTFFDRLSSFSKKGLDSKLFETTINTMLKDYLVIPPVKRQHLTVLAHQCLEANAQCLSQVKPPVTDSQAFFSALPDHIRQVESLERRIENFGEEAVTEYNQPDNTLDTSHRL